VLNRRSIDTVDGSSFGIRFRHPRYRDYCFSRLPWTVEWLLGAGDAARALPADTLPRGAAPRGRPAVDRVVLVFADSFGWGHFERYRDRYPFLERFVSGNAEKAVASKLTAMFPSTTASHVTCVHTGLEPVESGIYEWFQYHEAYDAVIAPLLFSFAGERDRDGMLAAGCDPSRLFEGETLHERLARARVRSRYVTPRSFTPSPYNDQVCRGALGFAYETFEGGLETASELLSDSPEGLEYLHLYYGDIDAASHRFGLYSVEMEAAVDRFLRGLERWVEALRPASARTLLLVSADHGMTPVRSETTVYLNQSWPEIGEHFQRDRGGAPIVPAGSPRDFFLHVEPSEAEAVAAALRERLAGVAEVHLTAALVEGGLFGEAPPSRDFLSRVGNVVVLPFAGEAVWWYEKGRFENRHRADHGGLTPEEMEIPLLALLV